MSTTTQQPVFAPGDRVRHAKGGELGTVVDAVPAPLGGWGSWAQVRVDWDGVDFAPRWFDVHLVEPAVRATVKIAANDLAVGDALLYPAWVGPTVVDRLVTVHSIVEYPGNRVAYFEPTNTPGNMAVIGREARLTKVVAR